ncbi:hypothetical protein DH2020_042571 [Rehmannia glutinosa]|uniref:1,3-beta-glucan synthase n=1 Tax=Rehmannia glutinosa TaxID=99300 RepID=A0ABR0UN26_REHGL
MARVSDNWEKLVRAVLRSEQRAGHERTPSGIAGSVPDSLQRTTNINAILQAADEIQSEDPNVARIPCICLDSNALYSASVDGGGLSVAELNNLVSSGDGRFMCVSGGNSMVVIRTLAYSMAQNLDPNSDGRGVLQFKTGLMSVIKQKLAKKDGGQIDRNRDIERFLELRFSEMKRVFATLRALVEVMEALSKDAAPEGVGRLIMEELRRIKKSNATISGELIPYNIVPLEAPSLTNAIGYFPEVRGAISAIRFTEQFPRLPADFEVSGQRDLDMFDLLEYVFGFQKDNIRNQREHVVLTLANAQSRLGIPVEADPVSDTFSLEAINRDRKLFLVSLYLCIWGEAANIRFLPNASAIYSTMYVFDACEAARNNNGKAAHSQWRNYDDFNEYFWTPACFELNWPMKIDSSFLLKPKKGKRVGKCYNAFYQMSYTNYAVHFFFGPHALPFLQALSIIAFNDGKLNLNTFKTLLSIGPTFAVMNFLEMELVACYIGCLDVVLMFGAYTTARGMAISRIVIRFLWCGLSSVFVLYVYLKLLAERNRNTSDSFYFRIYVLVLGVYAGVRERYFVGRGLVEKTTDYISYFMFAGVTADVSHGEDKIKPLVQPTRIIINLPRLQYSWHDLISKNNNNALTVASLWAPVVAFPVAQDAGYSQASLREIRSIEMVHKRFESFPEAFVKNLVSPQIKRLPFDRQSSQVYIKFGQVAYVSILKKLVEWTMQLQFSSSVICVSDVATPLCCFSEMSLGDSLNFSEVKMLVLRLELKPSSIHQLYVNILVCGSSASYPDISAVSGLRKDIELITSTTSHDNNKAYAAIFSPFWNEIIKSLREEDYISNREMDLLSMPSNTGSLKLVQWPLFLLSSKILLAIDLALDCKDTQADLWSRICKDEYMAYAVQECYSSIEKILHSLVDGEGRLWVERIFREINSSISEGSLVITLSLKKLPVVLSRFTALTGLLTRDPTPELAKGAAKAVYDFYDVVTHELLSPDLREQLDTWHILLRARNEGRLFSRIEWPKDPDIKEQVKRLHLLLTVKDSAANIPKNLEARRRLDVFTPYYSETVLYSNSELRVENEDGISILFYLQKIFPDEWENFLERIGKGDTGDAELQESSTSALELRFWASYRGQTLARTVRGMMYYRKALMLQSHLERRSIEENVSQTSFTTQGFELSREARAQADIKFTYVVSCQIYGQQKQRKAPEAADIALLLQRNEALRVAFIHVEESGAADGKITKEFYSKLVKADAHGKDQVMDLEVMLIPVALLTYLILKSPCHVQEIFSIKLPGDPKLGEGKPENQNHAIIFTRGEAVQTIDMNQDNYLEEAMKMRNLLEEFRGNHGLRPPTILGVREHVFTGSVSSLAWFMSNQETSFVTLGQRVLAKPLKVRMHYGHPDVFDRIFHVTRGGISKASRVINISEDIYAEVSASLEYAFASRLPVRSTVGKGRDVGLNQIALFEGKVAGGNGEQVLSRDIYRIGQLFDFFRMLSFFFTTVGYYVCTMMTVLTVYVFLYGRAYLAFSGLDQGISREARFLGNTALDAVLNAQFLVQIGVLTAVPMIMGFILELGLLQAVFSFITMQLQLCSVFFTFSLGTRTHYFGRTILHGGAKYRATGRGFVVRHIKFAENYRLYSRSHFVKALQIFVFRLEVALLLIVYMAYGYSEGGAVTFVLLTLSSWFLVISWLFAPYIFNPSGFEWQKTVEDFDDWTNWLMYKGGVGIKGDNSWESWWDEEQMHIQTLRGRILETILSLRFIMFQYGIVYKLHLTGKDTSIAVYGFSWAVLVGIVLIFKIFTFSPKKSTNFQLVLRFMQGVTSIGLIVALCLVVLFTDLSIADLLASVLAFIPTGWFILCLAITWKKIVRSLGLWDSVKEFARMYDAGMGIIIFAPIAVLSWFPFVSTFQSRLLFNQAFSRGLEISLILAGNKANVEASSF